MGARLHVHGQHIRAVGAWEEDAIHLMVNREKTERRGPTPPHLLTPAGPTL